MNYSILLFVVLVCGAKQIYSDNPTVTAFKSFKEILNNGYDKDMRPNLGENMSTDVAITLHIMDIDFDEKEKKLHSDMYFRQGWVDPRLANPNTEEKIVGGQSIADRIWRPDTFFPGSISVKSVKYPNSNVFAMIHPNGTVLFSERLQHTSRCHKKDETVFECSIPFESYGFGAKDLKYYLKKGPASLDITTERRNEADKQYKLVNYTIEAKEETFSFGTYSRVVIRLLFDNKPIETVVEEAAAVPPKDEPVNTKLLMKEGKKIHSMLEKIKLDLPQFPIRSQN